ncbi:ATP-dependent DNA helicase [Allopusillimonas soli]|uniref:ATP-dependent DNA helicase n=1 Tax=Allopusillimonas soli TaxID=659016 RepID=A0A853F618_9BURK|nr:ATP-dependent DNA helicase [Allopusillimonas soli]NYT35407.1 ATP-dependent DNA helicase [Allopusillimonas soli]
MNYTVSVRALCEFTAREGDLDLQFAPVPTALEGIAGHAAVRSRRPKGYEKEISLEDTIELAGGRHTLHVRGRADGYDAHRQQIEEIKTCRRPPEMLPHNHRSLHWAQARVYGHMLCKARGLARLRVALVYYDIDQEKETVLEVQHEASELATHFHALCARFASWALQETEHRLCRNRCLDALRFPFPAMRAGQRQLAEAAYKAALQSRCLLAQAPTGIGKTLGTLFPVLKSMPRAELDKVFFLTAKTPGRQLALDGLALIAAGIDTADDAAGSKPAPRVLELTAREKTCEHPDKACHGASCPLARGFYDRLPAARSEAVAAGRMDKAAVRAVALSHGLCPYWLSHDLTQWADIIVGDYNHYFDMNALLRSLTDNRQWRVAVLVDEAHNLPERARKMYSGALRPSALLAAQRHGPGNVRKAARAALKACQHLYRDQTTTYQSYTALPERLSGALQVLSAALTDHVETGADRLQGPGQAALALFDTATSRTEHHPETSSRQPHDKRKVQHTQGLAHPGTPYSDADLLRLHFDILHFLRLAACFGPHSVLDVTLAGENRLNDAGTLFSLRNLVPAPFLEPAFRISHSTVLFSATLTPWDFYRDTLGLPDDTAWVDVASPFDASQLHVRIARGISTRYRDRRQSITPIIRLMAKQYCTKPGNYLSYFSSFDYLEQVADAFALRYPDIPVWMQARNMDEAARDRFLQRFTAGGCGIGFAVLGGAFAEGIDLPGTRLIGAFVSTLGLPQYNDSNEQLRQCMERFFGPERGHDYAYLYPGLRKVVQAAGRVIRSDTDSGVVHLIDDRYAQPRVRALLPRWWSVRP